MIYTLKDKDKIKPVFKKRFIAVAFASDDSYIAQTAVMIRSIVDNSSENYNYDIVILSEGINQTNVNNVSVLAGNKLNISIRIFNITDLVKDITFYTNNLYTATRYSKEMYFRLFIPYLMPDYRTVVYFDGDMTALSDIAQLNKIDLGKNIVGATRDYSGIAACYDESSDRREYRISIGLKNLDNYFISSLVIFNIKLFNKSFSINDIKQIISERAWRQHDQDILNVLCRSKVKIIDAKWSFFEEFDYALKFLPPYLKKELLNAYKAPAVIHYAAERKGWKDKDSLFIKYFWHYAERTNYFDVFNGLLPSNDPAVRSYIFYNVLRKKIEYFYTYDDLVFLSTPYYVGKLSSIKICIEFLKIDSGVVYIDGFFEAVDILGKLKLYAVKNSEKIQIYNSDYFREYGYKSQIKKIRDFNFKTKIIPGDSIEFLLTYDDVHFIKPAYISVEQFAPLNENRHSFYCKDEFIVSKQQGRKIIFEKFSRRKKFEYTKRLCSEISQRKDKYYKRLAKIRWLFAFAKPFFKNKKIWLIGDSVDSVDKQTIELAEYLKKNTDITPFIVTGANNVKVATSCRVIKAKSAIHKFLYMFADCIVASTYILAFFKPCFNRSDEVRDILANKKYVLWCKRKINIDKYVKPWYKVDKFIVDNDEDYYKVVNGNNGYTSDNVIKLDRNNITIKNIANSLLGDKV